MDSGVAAALIGAAATLVGVGGTVIVAVIGFRNTRDANNRALDDARKANEATLNATRDGQRADRYTRAIDQLGSSTVDVTIGGVYALENLALDAPEVYHPTVMEVLAACIRENSKKPLHEPAPGADPREPPDPEPVIRPDIQAAMTVIARRDITRDRRRINLRSAHLPQADLPEAKLSGADLTDATLDGADLTGADLTGADLIRAKLGGARLRGADLSGAELTWARIDRLTDLNDAKWPQGFAAPEGWKLDTGSGRLKLAATDAGPAEAN